MNQSVKPSALNTEHLLKIAIENARIIVWELDLSNGELHYDEAMLKLLDIASETPPHTLENWLAIIHPDDQASFMQHFHTELATGTPQFDIEYRYARQSGLWGWAHSKGQVIQRDDSGNPLWVVGSTMNITQRKQAESDFLDAQNRFELIFNSSPDVMVISRLPEGCITNVNDAFVRHTGYSKKEAIGNTTLGLAFWSSEDRQIMTDAIARDGYCRNLEFDFTMKDGQKKYGSFSAVITKLQGIAHLVSTIHDITNRKQAEIKLQQSEALLRSTLESTDEGILMIAQDGHVLSANTRFMELWRIPQSLIDAKNDSLLLTHVIDQLIEPDAFMSLVQRLYNSDEVARDTLHFKDGRVFERFTQALFIGQQQGRIWCFKDISAIFNAQQQLQIFNHNLEMTLKAIPDLLFELDQDGLYLNVFAHDEALLAVQKQHLLGHRVSEKLPAEAAEIVMSALCEAKNTGYSQGQVIKLELADGMHWFELSTAHKISTDAKQRFIMLSRDITSRKNIEEELKKTKERYEFATSAGHVGTWDWSPITGILFWSDETFRLMGCKPGSITPSYELYLSLVHPDDRERLNTAVMAALHEDKPYSIDCKIVIANEKVKFCHITGTVEFNDHHQPTRMLGTIQDVTERKQNEIALATSLALFKTVIDTAPMRVFWKDTSSRYLGCNPSFARDAGVASEEELIGKDDTQLVWHAQAQLYREDDLQVMESGIAKLSYDEPQTTPDGQQIWLRTSKVPLRNAANEIIGILGIYEDITKQKQSELALYDSKIQAQNLSTLLRLICDNVPDMIWAKDMQQRFIFTNKAICDQLLDAADTSEPIGHDDMFFALRQRASHPDDPNWFTFGELCQDSDLVTWQNGTTSEFCEFGNIQGEFKVFDVHKAPLINEHGEVIGVVGSGRNITEQKAIEEKLRLAALVLENSSEGLLVTDVDNRIIDINPAFTRLTGYELAEIVGKDASILHSERQSSDFYLEKARQIKRTGRWQGEVWNRRKNGEIFAEWLTINTIYHDDGSIHRRVALFSDITDRKKSEELIWTQANYDHLTQLPNRRMFLDRLAQDIKKTHRNGEKLALLFLDLDHFKEVNDSLGHDFGDILLIEAARRIALCVRESDTVARLGGDEFTIILNELDDTSRVELIAENIIQALSQPFDLQGKDAYVTASIGITLYPDDALDVEHMLKNADQAMFVSKRAGRNRFSFFTGAMQQAAQHRLHIITDLRTAIAEQQFQLFFQPIIELKTGRLHKAEALIRWFHPTRGLISPADFIPLAEESGLIHEIGAWVFAEALKQAQQWHSIYGPDFQISVNMSPIQMQAAHGKTQWFHDLAKLGLSGQNFVFEITEGLLLDTSSNVTSQLLAFRDAGIQVAIDDFGTGYSALSYLKKMDIDYLKIDQSFIRNLTPDSSDMALSEAIIVMAHKLGLKVIAEGVETEAQHQLLTSVGCDYGQGYYYSRPVDKQAFEALLGKS